MTHDRWADLSRQCIDAQIARPQPRENAWEGYPRIEHAGCRERGRANRRPVFGDERGQEDGGREGQYIPAVGWNWILEMSLSPPPSLPYA